MIRERTRLRLMVAKSIVLDVVHSPLKRRGRDGLIVTLLILAVTISAPDRTFCSANA